MAVLRWLLLVLFGALVLVRVVVGPSSSGFEATYWARATPEGTPERSTDFLRLNGATRIDRALDFQGDTFPVHFFNDAARFNFGPDAQPARDQLPFTVRWSGVLEVPSDGTRQFVLDANGPARVVIDGAEVLSASGVAVRGFSAGAHALQVEYTRPEARVPRLRLTWERVPGGELEVVRTGQGFPVLDLVVLAAGAAAFAVWVWSRRAWPALLPVLFLGYGVALHAPLFGRATILSGLDDWMIYESSARDILLNGLLMTGGQERAAAYYGQPLYPYVLALAHLLTGEGLFGPLVLQFAALGGLLALAFVLARRAFDSTVAGWMALAALWLFMAVQPEYLKVARQLFNENLYMPLVMASLVVLVGVARRSSPPRWLRVVLIGVLLGVTAISRSQFLLFVPVALLILLLAWRRPLAVVLLLAGLVAAVAPVTARNWVVSGQFVPISASGGASLLEFHRPPPGLLDQAELQRDPLFEALRLDPSTRTVLGFARADPVGYLKTWLPLGAHSIGLPGRAAGAGVYWPLLVVVLLYAAAVALPAARRRHVWLIHGFVASHLLVLMLFEADTYGYRLVMPMYAPMLVVAAQLPLALTRRIPRLRWQLVPAAAAIVAVAVQGKALIDAWPDRETSLVGLGGPAARAATLADTARADFIYVASVDGTPRRFGAGALPGLRYPMFKWFDPARSLPLPAAQATAVYALAEIQGNAPRGDITGCLGVGTDIVLRGEDARARCAAGITTTQATFEGLANLQGIDVPARIEAGETAETRLLWEPLVKHPEPQQTWLHLEDAETGTLWGNGTLDLYPASEWEPGESLLSRLPIQTDATAVPDSYELALGMTPTRTNATAARATFAGGSGDKVPLARVELIPSTQALAMLDLPSGMAPVHGLSGGGLELIAARAPASEVIPGQRIRLGLLWRALQDGPSATQVHVQVVQPDGAQAQEVALPLFGGRVKPSSLRSGAVVRDEAAFDLGPRVAGEGLALEVWLDSPDAAIRVGTLDVAGRKHVLDESGREPKALFGGNMALMEYGVEPQRPRGGESVRFRMRWRAEKTMDRNYKVFVHVLDAALQNVVAQRDAQPQDGRAPTIGWLTKEVIDDEFEIKLPTGLATGAYPVEIGVYEERSGERLLLPSGESRFLFDTHLQVR